MLKALVIVPNDRTREMGSLLAIARAEAQKKEHTHENVRVRSILYDPVTKVFVALYERRSGPLVQGAKEKRGEK